MFLIGLTGLHRAGKSFFRESGIPEKYNYAVVNKKEIVILLCKRAYQREGKDFDEIINREILEKGLSLDCSDVQKQNIIWAHCNAWYGKQMNTQTINITRQVVDLARELYGERILLDAIHNNLEWHIIHEYLPESALLLFDTPKEVRDSRPGDDGNRVVAEKNIKRMKFWCSDSTLPVLPSFASWRIDGSQTFEEFERDFASFVACLEQGLEPKALSTETLEAAIGGDVAITDARDLILKGLLAECASVDEENRELREKLVADMSKTDSYCPTVEK